MSVKSTEAAVSNHILQLPCLTETLHLLLLKLYSPLVDKIAFANKLTK